MNPINRCGQKVVCIAQINVWLGDRNGKLYEGPTPKPEQVYTVGGFLESGFLFPGSGRMPGIALVEFECPVDVGFRPMGWPILAFVPVDDRKTDISELQRLAKSNKVTEPV